MNAEQVEIFTVDNLVVRWGLVDITKAYARREAIRIARVMGLRPLGNSWRKARFLKAAVLAAEGRAARL
jgi:hypothetical protein